MNKKKLTTEEKQRLRSLVELFGEDILPALYRTGKAQDEMRIAYKSMTKQIRIPITDEQRSAWQRELGISDELYEVLGSHFGWDEMEQFLYDTVGRSKAQKQAKRDPFWGIETK